MNTMIDEYGGVVIPTTQLTAEEKAEQKKILDEAGRQERIRWANNIAWVERMLKRKEAAKKGWETRRAIKLAEEAMARAALTE